MNQQSRIQTVTYMWQIDFKHRQSEGAPPQTTATRGQGFELHALTCTRIFPRVDTQCYTVHRCESVAVESGHAGGCEVTCGVFTVGQGVPTLVLFKTQLYIQTANEHTEGAHSYQLLGK